MSLGVRLGTWAVRVSTRGASRRLQQALAEPRAAQDNLLRQILAANTGTAWAADAGLTEGTGVAQFRERVSADTWEAFEPYVKRIAAGERHVLTREPVTRLMRDMDGAGESRLVPHTRGLRAEFARAVGPWIADMYGLDARVGRGAAYWSTAQPERHETHTTGGVPIGTERDIHCLPPLAGRLLGMTLAAPGSASDAGAPDAHPDATVVALLSRADLALISVRSPTFLTSLVERLDAQGELLLDAVASPARRDALARVCANGIPADLTRIWPHLALISCWADGPAARYLGAVQWRFPGVPVQGKGLLATEGVTSIPLRMAPDPVLAVNSHVVEFIAADGSEPRSGPVGPTEIIGACDADVGGRYEVVLTTSGGLYRYRTGDIVEIRGRVQDVPTMRFVGGGSTASNLVGEQLTDAFAGLCLSAATAASGVDPSMAMLVTVPGPPARYLLYAGDIRPDEAVALAGAVESELMASHHYRVARDANRLEALQVHAVRDGEQALRDGFRSAGARAGTAKPVVVSADQRWHDVLGSSNPQRGHRS